MTPPNAPDQPGKQGIAWDFTHRGVSRAILTLAVFAVLYSLLVLLGLVLHDNAEQLTILWPSAGLLFMALWLTPRHNWPWLLLVQIGSEIGVGALYAGHYDFGSHGLYPIANSVDAMVGALLLGRLVPTPRVPKLRNVVLFIASVAVGSAASAIIGAYSSTHSLFDAAYWREWQVWWAGNWLGSLCIAPIIMGWAIRLRAPEHSAPSAPPIETALIGFAMLGSSAWVFSAPPGGVTTLLDMPFVLLAVIVIAAFRLPPRWSALLAAATTVQVAYFASRGLGPFAGDPSPFVRVAAAQLYLATLVIVNFLLTVVLLERRNAYLMLRTSDERHRNFIEQSSEAVWRIELKEPMDPALPVAEQIAWIRAHASVAESNLAYQQLSREIGVSEPEAGRWRADAPWATIFIDNLENVARSNYRSEGLQFTMPVNAHQLTFITSFQGVFEKGKLARVWGVARDVSELAELNERLRQNQIKLKQYARELVGAEERARRATAVDLHDGIGQQLVGLSMTLNAMSARSPPEIRLLLSEATNTVREVQAIAQRVIADLSPPGLYELGLEPALKWLSVYMRSKDNLQVELRISGDDKAIDLNLRVLVFKVVRELLRNVVKHSGVQSATVTISRTDIELFVVVEDEGVGFEWQLSLFEPRQAGFGLWSIADRVREASGDMDVDTGPGRGCRVTLTFPLGVLHARPQDLEARAPASGTRR